MPPLNSYPAGRLGKVNTLLSVQQTQKSFSMIAGDSARRLAVAAKRSVRSAIRRRAHIIHESLTLLVLSHLADHGRDPVRRYRHSGEAPLLVRRRCRSWRDHLLIDSRSSKPPHGWNTIAWFLLAADTSFGAACPIWNTMPPIRTWRVRLSVKYTGLAGTGVDSPSRLAAAAPEGNTGLPCLADPAPRRFIRVGAVRDTEPLVHAGEPRDLRQAAESRRS